MLGGPKLLFSNENHPVLHHASDQSVKSNLSLVAGDLQSPISLQFPKFPIDSLSKSDSKSLKKRRVFLDKFGG